MFLYNDKHKNTSKFFLFYGFFVQKWSKKKERANKKTIITPFYLPFIISFSNKISVLDSLHNL